MILAACIRVRNFVSSLTGEALTLLPTCSDDPVVVRLQFPVKYEDPEAPTEYGGGAGG